MRVRSSHAQGEVICRCVTVEVAIFSRGCSSYVGPTRNLRI